MIRKENSNGGSNMKLNSIHHIAIITSDYKRTKHFYVDLLGFDIIRENYRPDKQDTKLDLRLGNACIRRKCRGVFR